MDVVPVPYDVYANKITNGVPRGNGPDLFLFAQERTGAWADAEIIAPLDGLVDGDALRGLPERMVDAFRYEGGLYGLPLSTKTVALYYRTDLLEEMGAEPPRTTDALVEASVAFTDREQGRFGWCTSTRLLLPQRWPSVGGTSKARMERRRCGARARATARLRRRAPE